MRTTDAARCITADRCAARACQPEQNARPDRARHRRAFFAARPPGI